MRGRVRIVVCTPGYRCTPRTVVPVQDDEGVLRKTERLELVEDSPDLMVHERDRSVVRMARSPRNIVIERGVDVKRPHLARRCVEERMRHPEKKSKKNKKNKKNKTQCVSESKDALYATCTLRTMPRPACPEEEACALRSRCLQSCTCPKTAAGRATACEVLQTPIE